MRLGDLAESASEALDRALTVTESLNAPAEVAGVRCSQACLAFELQDWEQARVHAGEAIETSGLAHTMRRTAPQWVLGMVNLFEGDLDTAREGFQERPRRNNGAHPATRLPSAWSGRGEHRSGAHREAASLDALDLWRSLGDPLAWWIPWWLSPSSRREQSRKELRSYSAAESLRDRAGAKATPREAAQVAAITASHGRISQPRAWPLGQSWTNPTPSPRPGG